MLSRGCCEPWRIHTISSLSEVRCHHSACLLRHLYSLFDQAGPSGCILASRLAKSAANPSVLLLEAGGPNSELADLSADERFNIAFKPDSPLNWGYKVHDERGREIDYSRGKGLGGSTAINFCGWVTGPSADYDEWARQVDDSAFGWANVQRHLASIVTLHRGVPKGFRSRIKPSEGGQSRSRITFVN